MKNKTEKDSAGGIPCGAAMQRYYIKEVLPVGDRQKNARGKARADVEGILDELGYQPITVAAAANRPGARGLAKHLDIARRWNDALGFLNRGDVLAMQFSIVMHSVFLVSTLRMLRKRGVITILITHDLETLRKSRLAGVKSRKKIISYVEEIWLMKAAGAVIVHNDRMKRLLDRYGIPEGKLISLGIFDYLIPGTEDEDLTCRDHKTDPVIIAGNLKRKKSEYLYHLPDCWEYNLYGVGYEDQGDENVHYFGSFLPEELPLILQGSFGLVWDGDSAETCSGVFGSYLKINNPHKTSLYLASGRPVIVWSQSAMADFVSENQVGITVDSLFDLKTAIEKVSEEDYARMCRNAQEISKKLRSGFYLRTAMEKAIAAAKSEF